MHGSGSRGVPLPSRTSGERAWPSVRALRASSADGGELGVMRSRTGARGLTGDAELGVSVRQVPLDGPDAEVQPRGDLIVAASARDELEHLLLACAELTRELADRLRLGVPEERVELVDERPPGRLALEQHVVPALERRELRAGDERRHQASLVEWDERVVARVHDERRYAELRSEACHVEPVAGGAKPGGDVRRGGAACQLA